MSRWPEIQYGKFLYIAAPMIDSARILTHYVPVERINYRLVDAIEKDAKKLPVHEMVNKYYNRIWNLIPGSFGGPIEDLDVIYGWGVETEFGYKVFDSELDAQEFIDDSERDF